MMLSDNIQRTPDGTLKFAGHSVPDLAEQYGTPLYLMDETRIRRNCRLYTQTFRECFGDAALPLYAGKAASFREIYRIVLGRFERPAGEDFPQAQWNNEVLPIEPKRMSRLTENLLRGLDYENIRRIRTENFHHLHEALGEDNLLSLRAGEGAYAYPLMLENGENVRRRLIEKKIYVPTLWPNVLEEQPAGSAASILTRQILPLPCDQRYGAEDMDLVIAAVRESLADKEERT